MDDGKPRGTERGDRRNHPIEPGQSFHGTALVEGNRARTREEETAIEALLQLLLVGDKERAAEIVQTVIDPEARERACKVVMEARPLWPHAKRHPLSQVTRESIETQYERTRIAENAALALMGIEKTTKQTQGPAK